MHNEAMRRVGRATVLAMRTRARYALLILLTLAVAAVAACSASAGQARAMLDPPSFNLPNPLANYAAGTTIRTRSLCAPAPEPGHSCGGPFVKNQRKPIGPRLGHGPYHFSVRKGFLPSGLVLHTNGLLTGTVLKYTKARRWSFTVCVSATTIVPNVGQAGSRCRPTSIVITRPPPTNFSGTWHGTFSGTISGQGCPDWPVGGPVTFSITQTGTTLSGTVTFTGTSLTWDPSSCVLTSRSDEALPFDATVTGLDATGGAIKLTMTADFSSFSGSFQGSGTTQATFTDVVRG
jgi:hypothetical protein